MFVIKTVQRLFNVVRPGHNVKCVSTGVAMEEPVVTVTEGKLKGSVEKLLNESSYYSFKGVPYAQPPVGELRFRAPLPPKPWEGIRDATKHGNVCPQFDMLTSELIEGSEDCLFLNVYTKTLKPNSKLPVMVFIHGGAYLSGSGDTDMYGPEFLLQHDVILVTMNYRLEVLGFLCLDTPEVPGNAGLKDQVAALRWVKNNIAQFGGNPDDVTLFGESAGSSAVNFHMLSPMSKGLFRKAICQSGVSLHDWSLASGPVERAFRVGNVLGKETNDANELLQFLRSVPAVNLTKMTMKTRTADEKNRGLPMYFVPAVEKKFDNVEAFITEKPIDALISGKVNNVPLLIGYNSAEGLLMLGDLLNKTMRFNAQPSFFVPREIVENVSEDKLEEFGARIKTFYFGNKDISNDTAEALVNLLTDINFSYQVHRFSHFYNSRAPTYMYWFNYESELNVFKNTLGLAHMKGACHADELFYLFYNPLSKEPYENDDKLKQVVLKVTKYWTDFAQTGNPSAARGEVAWRPYTSAGREYLALQDVPRAGNIADRERVNFWNKIYCDAGIPYITQSTL